MNKPRLRKLIKALRSEAGRSMFDILDFITVPKGALPPRQAFASGGGCGTTACIVGLAAVIDAGWRIDAHDPTLWSCLFPLFGQNSSPITSFAEWAGISRSDAATLSDPTGGLWISHELPTAAVAADVLEHYVKTGKLEYVVKEAKR